MGSKGSTTIEGVDPFEVARADATFNRIDQFTPFGSLTFSDTEGGFNNVANLQLNPAIAGLANSQIRSDQMLLQQSLGRQQQMAQGGLPSLTTGLNTQGLPGLFGFTPAIGDQQSFLGPQGGGFDSPVPNVDVPDFTGQAGTGSKGGSQPGTPPSPTKGDFGGGTPPPGTPPPTKGGAGLMNGIQRQQLQLGKPGPAPPQPAVQVPPSAPPPTGGAGLGGFAGQFQQQVGQLGGAKGGQPPQVPPTQGPTAGRIPQLNSLPGVQSGGFEKSRGRVEQAHFNRQQALLQPGFDQQQERLQQDLANRGIPRDSDAGRRELTSFRTSRDLALSGAANQAILSGGQEQSRLFGQQLAGSGFNRDTELSLFDAANQTRQTGLQDISFANQINSQVRNQEIQAQLQQANLSQSNRATQFNELASLLGLQQVSQPGLNNFFAPANVDVTGAFGLQQNAQIANARNSTALKGGSLGGAADIGSALIGAK